MKIHLDRIISVFFSMALLWVFAPPGRSQAEQIQSLQFDLISSLSIPSSDQTKTEIMNISAVEVASGSAHTCVLTTSGGVKCWGSDEHVQLGDDQWPVDRLVPVDVSGMASGISAIAAGGEHNCALTTGGGVKCWGSSLYGQIGNNLINTSIASPVNVSGLTSGVAAIGAGGNHTCALTVGGGVKCWGRNNYGQVGNNLMSYAVAAPVSVTGLASGVAAITLGGSHTCALTMAGEVKCWGYNDRGQLGDGTTTNRLTPVNVIGLDSGVTAIAAGGSHTCARMDAVHGGGIKCWGWNQYGQLGDGTTISQLTPVNVNGLAAGVVSLTLGETYTCAIMEEDHAWGVKCWGGNITGQLGDGTTTSRLTPVDVAGLFGNVGAIAGGNAHVCVLTLGGGVRCWGSNHRGQIGNGAANKSLVPVFVHEMTNGMAMVEAGSNHTCAKTLDGGGKCWGSNDGGKLGDGSTMYRITPADVFGLENDLETIVAGAGHSCAIITGGGVKCWGWNDDGELGDGTSTNRFTPVDVSGLSSGIASIAVGTHHSCALNTGGGVKCWGYNGEGRLGDGTTTPRLIPVDVTGLMSGIAAITTGSNHTCALTSGGGVMCWGRNGRGELGDNSTTDRLTPVSVSGLTSGVEAVAAGESHTCAILIGGIVKCWGYNADGQLGSGNYNSSLKPVTVIDLNDAVGITAGGSHTCARTTGGGVKCWGRNVVGQLGTGNTNTRVVPTAVSGLGSGVSAISAGTSHTCAVTIDDGVMCWGNNYYGELGIGEAGYFLSPQDVVGIGGTLVVSGQVLDIRHAPVSAVTISSSAGSSSITNESGFFTITGLITGTYTITPSKAGCTFHPAALPVSVPPDAIGQVFTAECQTFPIFLPTLLR